MDRQKIENEEIIKKGGGYCDDVVYSYTHKRVYK
jgi:hypothetical protein